MQMEVSIPYCQIYDAIWQHSGQALYCWIPVWKLQSRWKLWRLQHLGKGITISHSPFEKHLKTMPQWQKQPSLSFWWVGQCSSGGNVNFWRWNEVASDKPEEPWCLHWGLHRFPHCSCFYRAFHAIGIEHRQDCIVLETAWRPACSGDLHLFSVGSAFLSFFTWIFLTSTEYSSGDFQRSLIILAGWPETQIAAMSMAVLVVTWSWRGASRCLHNLTCSIHEFTNTIKDIVWNYCTQGSPHVPCVFCSLFACRVCSILFAGILASF